MSNSVDVNGLFKSAANQGALSKEAVRALTVVDIGAQIQEALGVPVDQVPASEVILLTQLIDDSGSIRFGSNAQFVRDGHNLTLEALMRSKQVDSILAQASLLNRGVVYPYNLISLAPKLDSHNYDPNGGTPLYDQTVATLGTVIAKTQEFSDQNGVPVRTITLIVTDGNDEGSRRHSPATVKPIVSDMLGQENHIIAAMGIDDRHTDFRAVFSEMGIPAEWILTPGNTESEIRKAFNVFSQSAVRASQNARSFSQAKLGGFGV